MQRTFIEPITEPGPDAWAYARRNHPRRQSDGDHADCKLSDPAPLADEPTSAMMREIDAPAWAGICETLIAGQDRLAVAMLVVSWLLLAMTLIRIALAWHAGRMG